MKWAEIAFFRPFYISFSSCQSSPFSIFPFFLSPVTLTVYQALTVNPAIFPLTLLSHRPDSSSGTQAGIQATHSYPSIHTYLATTPSILPKMTNQNPISIVVSLISTDISPISAVISSISGDD